MNTSQYSDDTRALWICNCIATTLSILGSIWTCYYCLKIRSSGNITLKLIIAITMSDFLYTIANFMSIFQTGSDTFFCKLEAPIREVSLRLTLFFSTCLAILIYKSSKFGSDFDQEIYIKRIITIGIGIFVYLSTS